MVKRLALLLLLVLPALALAEPTEPDIRVSLQSDRHSAWVREELILTLSVEEDRSVIELTVTPPSQSQYVIRALDKRQERRVIDGRIRQFHLHRYAVLPLYPGTQTLQFPPVRLRSTAAPGRTLDYPVPPLNLDIKALPAYLSPALPVSRLEAATLRAPEHVKPGEPALWEIRVLGRGLSADGLRPLIEEQRANDARLHNYPLETRLEAAPSDGDPARQALTLRLPLRIEGHEAYPLPAITLPYIDPQSGELQHLHIDGPMLGAAPSPYRWPLRIGLGFILALLVFFPLRDLWRYGRRLHHQRHLQHRLAQAKDLPSLRDTLLNATGQVTLSRLAQRNPNPAWMQALHALEQALYAPQTTPVELEPLRRDLIRWVPRDIALAQ